MFYKQVYKCRCDKKVIKILNLSEYFTEREREKRVKRKKIIEFKIACLLIHTLYKIYNFIYSVPKRI